MLYSNVYVLHELHFRSRSRKIYRHSFTHSVLGRNVICISCKLFWALRKGLLLSVELQIVRAITVKEVCGKSYLSSAFD